MSILITGATGFVISNLVRHLAEQGHAVVAADLKPPDPLLADYWNGLPGQVAFRQLDVTDRAAVRSLVADVRPSRVVHGAAITSVPPEAERARFLETVQVNVLGTLQVLEALRDVGTGRIVVVSSNSVYGGREHFEPVPEDSPKEPLALYPITKWAAEALARRYGQVFGLDLAAVRLCSPFGPFERDTGSRPLLSSVQVWASAGLRGEVVQVPGSPALMRDVAHVADVASGIATVLLAENLPHRVYNVGWGVGATSQQVLESLSRAIPDFRYEFRPDQPSPWVSDSNRPRGPISVERLKRDFGWSPRYNLDSGLAAYVEWLRSTGAYRA